MILAFIIRGQIDKEPACSYWNTAEFFEVANSGDVTRCLEATIFVRWFLWQKEADVKVKDKDGDTPLHYAAKYSQSNAVIITLVNAGADVTAQGKNGWTPLHIAARLCKPDQFIKALLDAGADVNAPTEEGETPLQEANDKCRNHGNSVIIETISRKVALISTTEERNQDTTSNVAFSRPQNEVNVSRDKENICSNWNTEAFFEEEKEDVVLRCLKEGSDPKAQDNFDMMTPLHYAVKYRQPDAVIDALLAEEGVDVNAKDRSERTPLHIAAWYSISRDVIDALVDKKDRKGADVEARNKDGRTPLHEAAWFSTTPEIITALAEAEADLDAKSDRNMTPLHVAARYNKSNKSSEVIEALLDAYEDDGARREALKKEDKAGMTPWDYAQKNDFLKETDTYDKLKQLSEPAPQVATKTSER